MVWYSHLLKNFPQFAVIHTVNGFSIVNEAEVDVCLEFPHFFYDSVDAGSLISASWAFSKSTLNIWKFSICVLLKPNLKDFGYYLATMWNECNCSVVWTFFPIALLWDWNENWYFPVLWSPLSFPNLLAYWVHTLTVSSFRIWNSSAKIPSPPLALFVVILSKAHLTSNSSVESSLVL